MDRKILVILQTMAESFIYNFTVEYLEIKKKINKQHN